EALADMPSNPSLQSHEWLPRFRQSVISPPASHVAVPVVAQLRTRAPPPTVPLLADFRFESFQALRCYADPLLPVQAKTQKLAFPDPPCPTLGGIHLQSQMFLDPALYRGQRAFRRRLTADVNIAVIRVPAIAMPPPIQFLIQVIQIDVRQQRRQRPALRRTFLTGLHQPLHHGSPPQVFPYQVQHPFVPDR